MRNRTRGTLGLAVSLVLFTLLAAPARAQEYTFTTIVDSDDGFDPFDFGCPAINDNGDVAVRGTRTSGTTVIFVVTADRVIRIADDSTRFSFLGRNPSINDRRVVSFAANLDDGGEAILRGRTRSLVTIAQTEPGPFNFFGFDTSVNDGGRVAFKAELDTFDEGLFSGRGGPITTHYLASSSPFQGEDSGPSINDLGQIAFSEDLDDGGQGIFRISGTSFITIADDSGPIGFAQKPSLNVNGVVAFDAFLDDGTEAIMTGGGGPLTTVADTTGPFAFFGFGGPSLNDQGLVAFTANLDSGEQGLFVGPDPVADRVVGTGDTLDGSIVANVSACREALNNSGELVLQAQLDDGRTVIAVASPIE